MKSIHSLITSQVIDAIRGTPRILMLAESCSSYEDLLKTGELHKMHPGIDWTNGKICEQEVNEFIKSIPREE